MIFTKEDYDKLSTLFDSDYEGYKPDVLELPNGDGKIDVGKRYLHIAIKYNPPDFALDYLHRAHAYANHQAELLSVPMDFYPVISNGTLRVLDYPVACGTAEHTDFDLFTINCFRSRVEDVQQLYDGKWVSGMPGYHMGEIGELLGLGKATTHRVLGMPYRQQSIVYFAMPSHEARIPGITVGEWLNERYSRSRVNK